MTLSYISFMLLKLALFEDAQNLFFLSQPLTPEGKKSFSGCASASGKQVCSSRPLYPKDSRLLQICLQG